MAKQFNPGRLRHKIDLFSPPAPDRKDAYGEYSDGWVLFKASVPASAEPLIGKELYAALTEDTKVEVKFRTRYIPGITNDMRVRYGGDVYEIISAVNADAANTELVFYCRRVRA